MSDAILRDTLGSLQVTFYSGGSAIDADAGVTVTIVGACGGTIVAAGTATAAGTAQPGVYSYALDPQAELDWLTSTWTGTFSGEAQSVQSITEVQGAFHVSTASLRGLDTISNTVTFPQARLEEKRRVWEYLAEDFCGVAFVPRFGHDVFDGDGGKALTLSKLRPRRVRSVSVDGAVVSDLSKFYVYDSGRLFRNDGGAFTAGYQNVEVCYEHGYDLPAPDVQEAALKTIEEFVLGDRSGVPARAETINAEIGTIQLGTLPPFAVRVLEAHSERILLVR